MTLRAGMRRGLAALTETGNLVSLTILFMASALTGDPGLCLMGLAAEALYLCLAVLLTCDCRARGRADGAASANPLAALVARYRRRLDLRAQFRGGGESFVLDQVLLIVTVLG